LLVAVLQAPPTFAAFPAENGKIAFEKNQYGNLEIFVMNADGSVQTAVTDNFMDDTSPAWSPDGSKIAFLGAQGSSPEDAKAGIFVISSDGTGATILFTIELHASGTMD
jgi:Tol biopolymer transport system component